MRERESEGEKESETTDAGLAWLVVAQNCCILSGDCSPCEAARISEFLGWNWTKNLLWFCFCLFLFFSLANVIDKFVVVEFFSLLLGGWRCVLFLLCCFLNFGLGFACSASSSSSTAACTTFAVFGRFWLDLCLVLLVFLLVFLLLCLLIFNWYFYCKFTGIYAVITLVFYWYLRLVFVSYYFNYIKAI